MSDKRIDIKGLDKADVLAVLYNASKPLGMGFMQYDPQLMTREEAQELIGAGQTYFDYLNGRVMKIDISGDELDPWGYDRDNGQGAVEKAVSALYSSKQTNPPEVKKAHVSGAQKSAREVKDNLHQKSGFDGKGTYHLGLDNVADVLNPKVDEAIKKLDDLKD